MHIAACGSSGGKTKQMENLRFGLFVHEPSASFDDLVITCDLSDEYLALANLCAAVEGGAH